jgi:hypothetical protein
VRESTEVTVNDISSAEKKTSIEQVQTIFGRMAETRGESDVTSAGVPVHRGHWPMAWQPRFQPEHNILVCNVVHARAGMCYDWSISLWWMARRQGPDALRLVYEPVVNGVQCQFEAVGDAEFVEDVVQVVLDGLLGDEKFFADFLVAEALGYELHNFFFAVAEQRLFAARPGFAGLRKRLHDLGRHAVVEPDFTGVHTMNTLHQEIRGGLLQHHAARAETHGANYVAIVFRGSQNDHARRQRIKINFLKHRQAVFVWHAQIEQENIGLELGKKLDALRAVLGFADDGDIFVGIEKFPQAIAKDRVVIG